MASSFNHTFPIGVDNNPLVNSLWLLDTSGGSSAPGGALIIITEDGKNIETESSQDLTTEGA
jgi:hypothetical protein